MPSKPSKHLGYTRHVAEALELDEPDPIAGHEALPWGKAYRLMAGRWDGKRPMEPWRSPSP